MKSLKLSFFVAFATLASVGASDGQLTASLDGGGISTPRLVTGSDGSTFANPGDVIARFGIFSSGIPSASSSLAFLNGDFVQFASAELTNVGPGFFTFGSFTADVTSEFFNQIGFLLIENASSGEFGVFTGSTLVFPASNPPAVDGATLTVDFRASIDSAIIGSLGFATGPGVGGLPSGNVDTFVLAPEPGGLALLGIAALCMALRRRR